ncbi:MAG TPA: choice-of-anchor D domain-containing protein, partial [Candidatus Kapabacteria bacterium]|nr:choice-of-anchor D domain-containing protein [Candidatus Kapabacteria bacterium]
TGGLQQQRIVNGQSQNYAEAVLYSPTGGIIGILDTHTHTISSVIVSKDGTIATGGKDSIVYLWKIQMPQSDISDNLWEIVAPQLTVNSIFMDSVIINIGSRDSLVENAITNTGEVAVRISSVTITGTNNQEFSRTIISPSLLLQPNESLALECNFSPTAIGKREAIITVETQDNYTAQGIISGEGISLLLENHPPIDFGKRFLGDTKDTIITAVIRNIGTIAVNFAAPRFLALNPNNIPFSFIQSPEKFTLKNQDSIEVKIRFSPTKLGQFTALLEYGFDKTGSPIRIPVFGEGICSNGADSLIVTSNAQSVAPGDTLTVALRLHYPPNAIQSATRPYRMTIDYDTTVLRRITPDADQFDTRLQSSDTVQYMRFLVMLGKSDTASVRVSSFDWGEYCTNAPAIIQGTVPVEICYAGGKRLFNPDGKLITGISPNPPN